MSKVAVITDSNSGITQKESQKLGISVLPMPFMINEETYFEDINLSQEEFYRYLESGADVVTSQPSPETVMGIWEKQLKEYDEVVHIPMSSGLSGSCQTAIMLSGQYGGRVQVVNNQRISVTQKQSAFDAYALAESGKSALEIKEILENDKMNSSIYIMVDTLHFLKKGGRITPAAAALGSILRIKPVLQIRGEKLDAFAKARTGVQGKSIMINAMKKDMETAFGGADKDNIWLQVAYTKNEIAAESFKRDLLEVFPDFPIIMDPLSLSIACHIGPGALAVACCKKLRVD